jgi:uncharacterized protein YabN with tetrapyrrole methylase and pyrophosphatase domain
MLMAQNAQSSMRTQYHFVQENLEDGIIKIEFFKSVEKEPDTFTKKVNQEIFEKHIEKILEEYIEGECSD